MLSIFIPIPIVPYPTTHNKVHTVCTLPGTSFWLDDESRVVGAVQGGVYGSGKWKWETELMGIKVGGGIVRITATGTKKRYPRGLSSPEVAEVIHGPRPPARRLFMCPTPTTVHSVRGWERGVVEFTFRSGSGVPVLQFQPRPLLLDPLFFFCCFPSVGHSSLFGVLSSGTLWRWTGGSLVPSSSSFSFAHLRHCMIIILLPRPGY